MIHIKNGKARWIRPWWIDKDGKVIVQPQMYVIQNES